jgi:hypothetical protein
MLMKSAGALRSSRVEFRSLIFSLVMTNYFNFQIILVFTLFRSYVVYSDTVLVWYSTYY